MLYLQYSLSLGGGDGRLASETWQRILHYKSVSPPAKSAFFSSPLVLFFVRHIDELPLLHEVNTY